MAQQICASEPEAGRLASSHRSRVAANLAETSLHLSAWKWHNAATGEGGGDLNINSRPYEYKK